MVGERTDCGMWKMNKVVFVLRVSLDESRTTWHRAASILKMCIELHTVLAAKDLNLNSEILFVFGMCRGITFRPKKGRM